MAFSLGVVLAVRLLEAVAVNASRSTALAMAAKRADVRSDRFLHISRQCVNEPMGYGSGGLFFNDARHTRTRINQTRIRARKICGATLCDFSRAAYGPLARRVLAPY